MKTNRAIVAILLAAAVLMGGCKNTSQPAASPYPDAVYGVVEAIDGNRDGSGSIGAGAIIGGIVGGVLGSQMGNGRGQDAATLAGVIAGAVVGHQIEKSNQQGSYQIRVKLDNGDHETITQQDIADLHPGDRVRIENNRVSRY